MKFRGTATALVTPFNADNSIDFETFGRLIDHQIAAGVEGVVACGSTGESATMSSDEREAVIRFTVDRVNKRIKVIAGTGSNDTAATIKATQKAKSLGVDAALIVGPYYNKPTQYGYFEHYRSIADAVDLPLIIYNVPGRTASSIAPETQLRLAEYSKNFIATKEASANLDHIQEIIRAAPSHFGVLSGDDSLTLPIVACGGVGTIAVISNYYPKRFSDCVRAALAGDFAKARELQYSMLPMMKLNFIESNPIPVKFIVSELLGNSNTLRLPLTSITEQHAEIIRSEMAACQLTAIS